MNYSDENKRLLETFKMFWPECTGFYIGKRYVEHHGVEMKNECDLTLVRTFLNLEEETVEMQQVLVQNNLEQSCTTLNEVLSASINDPVFFEGLGHFIVRNCSDRCWVELPHRRAPI